MRQNMRHCLVASPLNLTVQSFRVLRALRDVLKEYKNAGRRIPAETVTMEVVTYLAMKRPGVAPYHQNVVESEIQQLIRYGLVREYKKEDLQFFNIYDNQFIELTLTSTDPRFEQYQQWYSPQKQIAAVVSEGVAAVA